MVRTPSVGELTIYDEGTKVDLVYCSSVKGRRYIQHGCMGYIIYVVDTWEEKKYMMPDVPIVREFPDALLEDFRGVPLERQFEFRIDLIPGAAR